LETIIREFQSFDVLIENKFADIIVGSETVKICKFDFRVAGTNESRHGLGNRCYVNNTSKPGSKEIAGYLDFLEEQNIE